MKRLLPLCLALSATFLSASTFAASGAEREQRADLSYQLVKRWGGHVQEAYGMPVREWAQAMIPVLKKAPLNQLVQAGRARSFESMNDALLGDVSQRQSSIAVTQNELVNGNSRIASKALGDAASDLVFVPVTPCRIIDTRVAGGQITANTVRSFDVASLSDYSFQGGDASNCNGVGAAGSFAAAAINFTVVTPSGAGYITAFPFLATQPLAATVNYTAGDIRGNFAVVKMDQGASANELSVYTFATTHLVADIVGYYIEPQATALECVEKLSSGNTIPAGSFGTQSTASCDAGYTITGGGCSMSNFDGRVVTTRTIVSGSTQQHFCAFRNEGTGSVDGLAYARCCRTPGR